MTQNKKIFIQPVSEKYANNFIFEPDVNGMSEPWRLLRMKLSEIGYDLVTADNNSLDNCAYILFLDSSSVGDFKQWEGCLRWLFRKLVGREENSRRPRRHIYEEAMEGGMGDKMALFLWEGSVVNPMNYSRVVQDKFKTILTWNDDLVENKKFFKFRLPTPLRSKVELVPFSQKKLLVNISANRYYSNPNELYSARRNTSSYFCKNHPDDFDLFGARWHMAITKWQQLFPWLIPKFACLRGVTEDKIKTMSKYKFVLSYENLSNVNGYVTEKIFDALQARSVPIYWGAPNICDYVDEDVFINRTHFKNDAELAVFLKNMKEEDYNNMLLAGEKYLKSDKFKKFLSESFCDTIIKTIL